MNKRIIRDKEKEVFKNIRLDGRLWDNPAFIIYTSQRMIEGFSFTMDSKHLYLRLDNDLCRNDGKRVAREIAFSLGSIYDQGKEIEGIFIYDVEEVRLGNFSYLVLDRFSSWKYHKNLKGTISFYDNDGVLMSKQIIRTSEYTNYQDGYLGIEAYNTDLYPYRDFLKRIIRSITGIMDVNPIYLRGSSNTFYKRNSQDYDKVFLKVMRENYIRRQVITNNGDDIKDLNVFKPLNYRYRDFSEIIKGDKYLAKFYNGDYVDLKMFLEEEGSIYQKLVQGLGARVENISENK